MKFYLSILTILAAAVLPVAAETTRPNIILVLIDDMGWGDFSCFGNEETKTPNIDRLASEGIRFSQFYVNSPICSPSRCGITTGQYPQRWRITSFLNDRKDNERRGIAQWLAPEAPTLARFLQKAGYATGHFGKWHLGGQRDVDDAPAITSYGYDESLTNFEGMGPKLLPLTLKPGDKKPGKIWDDAERLGGPVTWMQRSKITGGYIDQAIPFINKAVANKKPFYINLWPDDVHSPYWPPVDQWTDSKRGMYLAVLRQMDQQFGKLFDHIRDTPELRENTLILVCSDNGPEPGAGSAGPFRGVKGTLYEGGVRSPLIVWGPGLIDSSMAGHHDETSVLAAMDLVPSLLTLAGTVAPEKVSFDGEDHSSALIGKGSTPRNKPIFWRRPPDRHVLPGSSNPEKLPDLSTRDGKWKLLCTYDGTSPQLYDVEKDLGETTNLAAANSEVVDRLIRSVVSWSETMPPDDGPRIGSDVGERKGKRKATP
jgi:arylsulfatase A-like enzyme